jgi:hypothetical protein
MENLVVFPFCSCLHFNFFIVVYPYLLFISQRNFLETFHLFATFFFFFLLNHCNLLCISLLCSLQFSAYCSVYCTMDTEEIVSYRLTYDQLKKSTVGTASCNLRASFNVQWKNSSQVEENFEDCKIEKYQIWW